MITKIIEKYKNYKKQSFLDLPDSYKNNYAFAGVGGHSISSLYPILMYKAVPLKIIFSRSENNAQKMAARFKDARATNNIDLICNSDDIHGVFLCLKADHHFEYLKKIISAGKNVFVEKPPCTSLSELEELISLEKKAKVHVLTGLQRRYSNVYNKLKNSFKKPISYNYKFYTGSYPEGSVYYDLFIHPIDIIIYLFGEVSDIKINTVKNNKGISISLLLKHSSGCLGVADISTMYSWRKLEEKLSVVTADSVFTAEYPLSLSEEKLQKQIAGVPLEKILPSDYNISKSYFDNNMLNPIFKDNSLYYQGFFDEVGTFLNLSENKKAKNESTLNSLMETYKQLEELKAASKQS